MIRRLVERLRARVHAWTAPPPAPPRQVPPLREGELPMLRLVAVPGPSPSDPSDLLLVRATEAFLLSYPELSLLESAAGRLRDGLARRSPFYQPADVPPPAAPVN